MLVALLLLGTAGTAAAHGFVSNINIAGNDYEGYKVDTAPWAETPPELIAWSTSATDQGYTDDYNGPDIICHRDAAPGALSGEVAAGDTVTVKWNQWLSDHKGPVIDYLANCNGDCATVDKTTLEFFKIDAKGLTAGTWASDELLANGASWDITIPADLKAGNYVLRHEIIALHGAPQFYPQCVNLKVTGSGTSTPSGTPGMQLYSKTEKGFNTNIWQEPTEYKLPGPALYRTGDDTESEPAPEPASSDPAPPASTSNETPAPSPVAPPAETPASSSSESITPASAGTESPTACSADYGSSTDTASSTTASANATPTVISVTIDNMELACTIKRYL
ncbi:glycosyl hydrolase family 61-domain-containing protein [Aspergillus cavernicola]|uniref:Glycosyl hydrolase family 61-domain-containing protein n=1 Tax=Aspergillus cavernicola TaxID=176166 RepID=A0ABR4IP39_9EURO